MTADGGVDGLLERLGEVRRPAHAYHHYQCAACTKLLRQPSGAPNNLIRRMRTASKRQNALLKIDNHKGSFFRVKFWHVSSCYMRYFAHTVSVNGVNPGHKFC